MDRENSWIELEEAYERLSCLLNTFGLMVLGLMQARDPYADGFNALLGCLTEADREVQRRLSDCQRTA